MTNVYVFSIAWLYLNDSVTNKNVTNKNDDLKNKSLVTNRYHWYGRFWKRGDPARECTGPDSYRICAQWNFH